MLIYVHGFNSSPASIKARQLGARLESIGRAAEFSCPALPDRPDDAIAVLERELRRHAAESITLVGSSLGGYYATHVAERFGLRTVLLNPVVRPYDLLHDYVGIQRNLYTGEEIVVEARHLGELRALEVEPLAAPSRYFLIVTTGDEVLDYRQAVEKYRGARQLVIEGGDHSLNTFPAYLDDALRFCGVAVPSPPRV